MIGGTSDSVAIANILIDNKISFVVSATTQSARDIYAVGTQVEIGCMDRSKMKRFCQQENIKAIVDASHPYAAEVSLSAIAVADWLDLSYLRYERSDYQISNFKKEKSSIIELDSFNTLLSGNYLQDRKVLLTVGCKVLPRFQAWQKQATLYARVLPKIKSLNVALQAGFTNNRIIAIRPPLTIELETALWQQWKISLVVAKASGKAGGEDIKRQVAASLNIPLIIIARPQIDYLQKTTNLKEVIAFCQKIINIESSNLQ